ncbi:hypothetical protein EVAR_36635_1 [Eumeta japonica]|uniref:Uncharacterized protein n=1 Tax=Eumeta variegata TaxID=151549 RepID=A0A4C1YQV3_EUMVA|nr:hypothetical protein EVAR_36635_1 [Eumeta japonica]
MANVLPPYASRAIKIWLSHHNRYGQLIATRRCSKEEHSLPKKSDNVTPLRLHPAKLAGYKDVTSPDLAGRGPSGWTASGAARAPKAVEENASQHLRRGRTSYVDGESETTKHIEKYDKIVIIFYVA